MREGSPLGVAPTTRATDPSIGAHAPRPRCAVPSVCWRAKVASAAFGSTLSPSARAMSISRFATMPFTGRETRRS